MVEVTRESNEIWWKRFGVDTTSSDLLPEGIGKDVEWMEGIGPFVFSLSDYILFLDTFKKNTENKT